MNAQQAIAAIYQGNLVDCTAEEWRAGDLRRAIQGQAGKWIDYDDHLRAQIALQEVRRLDALHGSPFDEEVSP